MRTLLSDSNNDIALAPSGNVHAVTGSAAVEQVAKHHMLTRRDEMIHAMEQGIPFDLIVWGASPNIAQFEAAGRARLLQVPGVIEVVEFTAQQVGDTLDYVATIRTEFGEVSLGG